MTLFLQQPSHNSNIFEQVNIRTRTDDSREVTQLSDIMQVTYFLTIIPIFPICKRAFIEVRNGLYHLPISPISCTDMMLFAHQNGPFRIANRFFRHFCSHLTVTKNAISHFSVFYFASKSGGFFWQNIFTNRIRDIIYIYCRRAILLIHAHLPPAPYLRKKRH